MKLKVVAIRDRAADAFGIPNFVVSLGGAVRGFADEVNRKDPQNMLSLHPEDFDMFELGVYDDGNGSFELHEPRQIAIGKDLVK